MPNHPLHNWIPYKLNFNTDEILCRWLYVGDKTFTEPFFDETTSKCLAYPENGHGFHSVTTLEGLSELSKNLPVVAPTAFIFHVSRCGSTLLAQLLSLDSQHIVVSEPPILDDVLRQTAFKKSKISAQQINESAQAVIQLLGQKRRGDETHFFIKLDSWHIFYYQQLRNLYPYTPFIFSFRKPDEVIRSQVRNAGMHATQGIIQPDLFGFIAEKIMFLERPIYIAKVLERYFEEYLKIAESDKNTLFINYAEGTIPILTKIENFLQLSIDSTVKTDMIARTQFHSKNANAIFDEKIIETELPDYQQYVYELYEKLVVFRRAGSPPYQ